MNITFGIFVVWMTLVLIKSIVHKYVEMVRVDLKLNHWQNVVVFEHYDVIII